MIDETMEKKLLHAVQREESIEECLREENSWPVLCHLSNIRENLLEWYEFAPEASLLEIGAECGALTGLFCRRVARVAAVELSERACAVNSARNGKYGNLTVVQGDFCHMEIEEKFDYVVIEEAYECSGCSVSSNAPYVALLKKAGACLKPGGRLFLAMENKYGLKYFAGAAEAHTGRCFDGLENYVRVGDVRTFSRKTLKNMLLEAGFSRSEFYYPMPDDKLPSEIYSDRCLPSFGSIRYPCIAYDYDRYELFDERLAFDSICQDGMFGDFANAFLVISDYGKRDALEKQGTTGKERRGTVVYAKYNRERAPQFQLSTKIIVGENGSRWVEKEALRPEAKEHVARLSENRKKLMEFYAAWEGQEAPVPVELLRNENGRAVFSHIDGVSLAKEVTSHLGSREDFLEAMHGAIDSIYGIFEKNEASLEDFKITGEFERIFGTYGDWEDTDIFQDMKSLKVSDVDSILSNFVRRSDGSLVCLDYEWVFDFPIPLEYLKYRTVFYYYSENVHYIKMSEPELWAEFGLTEKKIRFFRRMDDQFQQYAHGKNRSSVYTANYAKKTRNIGSNLQNGERWFLSVADDIQYLNCHLGTYRRDLVRCRVKTRRKSVFWDKCKNRLKRMRKRP